MRRNTVLLCIGIVLLWPGLSSAAPLTQARVTNIVNQVKLSDPVAGERDAQLDDIVRGDLALTTGIKSRSELVFQDNTLTRLGPESYFSFKSGTRDLTLQRGTLLLQVPKGIGGAKIHTASVTAAVTGTTIMMEYVPQKHLKVLVLEGSLRLSMNGRFGDSLLVLPGRMVIMPPNARRIPDPVTVDLKKIVQTSSLVNMRHGKKDEAAPLPSMHLVEQEVDRQQHGKDAHRLRDTNLVILGKGTNVVLGSDDLMDQLAVRNDIARLTLGQVATGPMPPPPPPGTYVTDNTTVINTRLSGPTIVTAGGTRHGIIYQDFETNGSPAAFLFGGSSAFDTTFGFDNFYLQKFKPSTVFTFASLQLGGGITFETEDGPSNLALVGINGIANSAASTVNLGGINRLLFATEAGNITLDSGISFTGTNDKPSLLQFYARGGDVNIGSTFTLTRSDIRFAAEANAIFAPSATFTAKNLTVTGEQTVQFDGSATISSNFQLNGGDVEMGGSATANAAHIFGQSATINGSINSQTLSGNVSGDFVVNSVGALTTSGDLAITPGGNLTLDGMISSHKLDLMATGNFSLGSAGTLTSTSDTNISSSGGTITVDGALNSGHNVTLTASGNVAIDHAITASQLTITGGTVSFGTDFAVVTSGNTVTATNGNLDATGHQLTGFDQISVTNGDLIAGGVSANRLTINQSGNVNVTNDLVLAQSLSVAGSVNVGGLLSTPSLTAGDITTAALHSNNVTLSGALTLNSTDLAPLSGSNVTINAPTVSLVAGATLDGQAGTPTAAPGDASNLAIATGAFTLGAALTLNGGDANPTRTDAGGNGGQLDITSTDSITLNSPILATTGQNSNNGLTGGNGGNVNLTAENTVTLNSTIEVSSDDGNRRRSSRAGNINVTSNKTSGTAIAVTSSAQLLALLNSTASGGGGSIKFVSAGGDINVDTATIQADRGTIDIRNNGVGGAITLNNATLSASTIKVGALGNNGTLNVGGGSLSADSIIKLYAGGSNGTINFTENVTLNGSSVKTIAGDTVTIFNGKVVTVNGQAPANVFTNHPNYTGFGGNGSTTGTFAGQGATTSPLSGAPGY